jgi:hypothetical protein
MVAHIVTTGLRGHEIKVSLITRPEHELGTILVEHCGVAQFDGREEIGGCQLV